MPAPPPPGLSPEARLRHEVTALLRGRQAHVDAPTALGGIPEARVLDRPDGAPHSLFEIAWHLRFTLRDILDFCSDAGYAEPAWPDAYWPPPETVARADGAAYRAEAEAFLADTEALVDLVQTADLLAELPHAPGYTVLREATLAADHAAYHLGEAVALRRRLGVWP